MNEQSKSTKFCVSCGEKIDFKAEICPKCGVKQPVEKNSRSVVVLKNPGVAAVLSFFIPGLGQIYNGEIILGFWFLIFQTLLLYLAFFRNYKFLFLVSIILWILGIVDAYKATEDINRKIKNKKVWKSFKENCRGLKIKSFKNCSDLINRHKRLFKDVWPWYPCSLVWMFSCDNS